MKKVPTDPSEAIEKQGNDLLDRFFETADIKPYVQKHLLSHHSVAPVMKCNMKDHKDSFPDCKVRPVQPVRGSAIEKLDILVSKILTQLGSVLTYRVFNSKQFQEKVKCHKIPTGKVMVSMDVVSMFETLPTDEKALGVIRTYLEKHKDKVDMFGYSTDDVIEMLKFVLNNSYVNIEGDFYRQGIGVCTGGHTSPPYSDIIIDYTFCTAIENTETDPEKLSLYVDDSRALWDEDEVALNIFKRELESIWETVKFTLNETEKEGKLVF